MKEIKTLTTESIIKEFFVKHKNFDKKGWSNFWEDYKKSPIANDIKLIIELCVQRIRSACEFYLRYKDKPDLFCEEQFQVNWKYYLKTAGYVIVDEEGKCTDYYNDWLFKKSILKCIKGIKNENFETIEGNLEE